MKLLYTFIIAAVLQLLGSRYAIAITSPNTMKMAENKLKTFSQNGINLLSKEFCAKAKILSEEIVKDLKTATPQVQKFRMEIEHFLHIYSMYERLELFADLWNIFYDMINVFMGKGQTDSEYILKLLNDKGYKTLINDYEQKRAEFIKQKFLPKFEEFKTQLSPEDIKNRPLLLKYYEVLKLCGNFNCYNENFLKILEQFETPKENLMKYLDKMIDHMVISEVMAAYKISEAILKDQKLTQLSSNLKQNLIKDLKEFETRYKRSNQFERLYELITYFDLVITNEYYKSTKNSLRDQQLLKEIFERNGYTEFNNNRKYFEDFAEQTIPKIYEKYENYSSKEMSLMKWLKELPEIKAFEQKIKTLLKFGQKK
ncbi:uncharacterized protein ACRADG_005381 [Cochliomyia hominivorax]